MNIFQLSLKSLKILGWVSVACALITLTICFFVYRHSQKFVQSANRAQGTVTQLLERSDSHSGSSYYPVYTFQDSQGAQHEIYSSFSSYPPSYEVGEKITVLYQPDNPQNAEIDDFMGKWFLSVLLAGVGLFELLFGLGLFTVAFIIRKAKSPPPIPPAKI